MHCFVFFNPVAERVYRVALFPSFMREIAVCVCVCVCAHCCFSCVQLFATLWTCQAPLSMGFYRQEHWSGLLCPPPGDLPDPGIELASLMSPASVGWSFTVSATWECRIKCLLKACRQLLVKRN